LNDILRSVPAFVTAIGLSALGSLGGVLMASLFLFVGDRLRPRLVPWLISYAVGTLLGAALLGLLPQALETLAPPAVFGTLLSGILTFFVLEKLVLWRHCHDEHECGSPQHRLAHRDRRRVPHLRRRCRDRDGRYGVAATGPHYGSRCGGARDSAGSR
jgi:zinc transporter ZupT